jgi:hypothetical protein
LRVYSSKVVPVPEPYPVLPVLVLISVSDSDPVTNPDPFYECGSGREKISPKKRKKMKSEDQKNIEKISTYEIIPIFYAVPVIFSKEFGIKMFNVRKIR